MTREEAIAAIEPRRAALGIAADMVLASARRAIVAVVKERDRPRPIVDRVAWILEYDGLGTVRVVLDDRSGDILETERDF